MADGLNLGNIREWASSEAAYDRAVVGEDKRLDPGARTFSGKIGMALSKPFRWLGRAVQWATADAATRQEGQQAATKIRQSLESAYGQELVNRFGGDLFREAEHAQSGGGVTAREISSLLSSLDTEIATRRTQNLADALPHLRLELDGLLEGETIDKQTRDEIEHEVSTLIRSDPMLRRDAGDNADTIRPKIEAYITASLNRRSALMRQRLPNLSPSVVATSTEGALRMEGRRCLESLKDTPDLGHLNSVELSLYRWVDTMFNAAALRVEGMEGLLAKSPVDDLQAFARDVQDRKSGAEEFRGEIDIAIDELQQRAQKYESGGRDEDARNVRDVVQSFQNLKTDMQRYEGLLDAHLNEVRTLATVHPLSVKDLRKNENLLDESTIIAIDKEIATRQQKDNSDPAIGRLTLLRGNITQRITERNRQPAPDEVRDFETVKNEIDDLKFQNAYDLAQAMLGFPNPEDTDDMFELVELLGQVSAVAELIENSFNQALNTRQPWDIIQDDFSLHLGGQTNDFTSTITPIAKSEKPTGGDLLDQDKVVSKRYEADGINGVTAMDRSNHKHGCNIASTKLESGGKVLFQGIRHGVYTTAKFNPEKLPPNELADLKDELGLDATAGKEEVIRAVEKRRAMEGVTLALQTNRAVLNEAVRVAVDGGDPPTLNILSTNLQTGSDTFEDSNKTSLEGGLINQQTEALMSIVKDGVIDIPIVDSTGAARIVQVKVNVVPVNYPVNPGGTAGIGSRRRDDSIRDALQVMTGSHVVDDPIGGLADTYMQDPLVSESDKAIVRDLVTQIRQIASGESVYKPDGTPDVYALPARMNLLAFKLGMSPMFNCKSGKDRTGHLDLETKFLAARIKSTGRVPSPGELTTEEREAFGVVALKSGNLAMQRYNTGIGGYKTVNQKLLLDRMAPWLLERYRGGSKLVAH
jgi:Enterobacterial virulence protein IpgD